MKIFLPVFRSLSENNIRYVTVGGFATVLHGFARLTGDIDLVIDLEAVNLRQALSGLSTLGFKPRAPVDIMDFADPAIRTAWIEEKGMLVFSLWRSTGFPLEVDIFVKEPAPFSQLFANSKIVEIEEVPIRIASIDDIIKLKRAAGRPEDLVDIQALEAIKAATKN